MPENKLARVADRQALADLVPKHLMNQWYEDRPVAGEWAYFLGSGFSFMTMRASMRLGALELSGSIGPDWLTRSIGTVDSAPSEGRHVFSWHYHPDCDCSFSLEDWYVFIVSDALLSILVTTHEIGFYYKKPMGQWVQVKSQCGRSIPRTLRFLRFKRRLDNLLDVPEHICAGDAAVAACTGIHYEKFRIE